MFTRCPECETTFRLGAQDLRRAGGKVRCGECETVFNALDYLEEEAEARSRAGAPWQTKPASDAHAEPEAEYGAFGTEDDAADTLYDDDYEGPIGDPPDRLRTYPNTEADSDTETDASDEPDGAGILVIDPDDDAPGGDGAAWRADNGPESGFDSAAADRVPADKPDRWPTYAEPDDDDDIVSFVSAPRSAADYPEVSVAVGAAIGISPAAGSDDPDEEDESYPADETAQNDEPGIVFDEELFSTDDESIEFIISGDADDADDEFIPVPGIGDNDDDDSGDVNDQAIRPPTGAANDDVDEFDDAVWERIPGVGSSETNANDSRFAKPGFRQLESAIDTDQEQRREPVILDETTDTGALDAAAPVDEDEDESGEEPDSATVADPLEFNAPADTWSSIFSRSSRAARTPELSGDTQPLPVITEEQADTEAEELAAWYRELHDGDLTGEPVLRTTDEDTDAVVEANDRADWVSELGDEDTDAAAVEDPAEWLAEGATNNGGENSSASATNFDNWEDWVTEQDERSAAADSPQPDLAASSVDDTNNYAVVYPEQMDGPDASGEHADAPDETTAAESTPESDDDRASLTAAFATGELNEADYDVQHIVLADKSKPDSAGLTHAFALAAQEDAPPWRPETPEHLPASNTRALFWLVGGVLVVATLALQLVHYNRDVLAGSQAWGDTIRGVYHRLGMELYPNWSLDDYEIRGSEAIAGESGPDVMDIRAQIAAIGKEPVGLPHIRLVLRDRWSNPVAAKTVTPSEYAAPDSLPSDELLRPNETLAAHVSIIDPGSGAQGFELELCLPRRHTGLECTGRPFK